MLILFQIKDGGYFSMTTEKTIGNNQINVFVIQPDHQCLLYEGLNHETFEKTLRKLMLKQDIETYQDLSFVLKEEISEQKIRSFFLEKSLPDLNEFLIIANFFKVPPDIFMDYRQIKNQQELEKDNLENIISQGLELEEERYKYNNELNSLLLKDDEFEELEDLLRE